MKAAIALTISLVTFLVFYLNVTIFVVQPIGAVPEGRTLLVFRQGALRFIDSADAICERTQGGVSLLCRGMVLGAVAKNTTILVGLPYSDSLYLFSTGGRRYGT